MFFTPEGFVIRVSDCTTLIHPTVQYSGMGYINRWWGIVLLFALLTLAAPVSAATGTIQVNVHPGGGTICLGTTCRDCPVMTEGPASVTFENMEAGQYHMLNVFGTPGYEPWLGQIYLNPSGTALTRDIYLKALPPKPPETANVQLSIRPDGGRACINRMCELSSGDGTGSWSVQFTDIAANTNHTVTIAREGNATWTTKVRLLPGQTSTMSVVLEPLPPVESPPPTPVPVTTPVPEPTRAGLPAWLAFLAFGACCTVWVLKGRRQG